MNEHSACGALLTLRMLWMTRAGNDRASVTKGCELLLKILDANLAQPDEEKYVLPLEQPNACVESFNPLSSTGYQGRKQRNSRVDTFEHLRGRVVLRYRRIRTENKAFSQLLALAGGHALFRQTLNSARTVLLVASAHPVRVCNGTDKHGCLLSAMLVAMTGARDLIFRVGFEPTSDFLHLVLPPRKIAAAAHAKKALLIASGSRQRSVR